VNKHSNLKPFHVLTVQIVKIHKHKIKINAMLHGVAIIRWRHLPNVNYRR